MSVPNQKIVVNHTKKKSNKEKNQLVAVVLQDNYWTAYQELGPAITLWFYIAENADGHRFELSSIDYCNKSKDSRSSFTRYCKKLIDTGYLVPRDEDSNIYDFYADKTDHVVTQVIPLDSQVKSITPPAGFKF